MKKTLLIILASAALLSGCEKKADEVFEEVQKVDVEISDYVESEEIADETEAEIVPEEPVIQEQAAEKDAKVEEPEAETPVVKAPEVKEESQKPAQQEKVDYSQMSLSGKVICIDAAHGEFSENIMEAIAPNLSLVKQGFKEGTKGANITEDEITLAVANILKEKLEAKGAAVLMTRTDATTKLSNAQRAEFANNNGANICIKLHADGTDEGGSGMTMIVPGNTYIKDANLLKESKYLGKTVLNGAVSKTGAVKRGVYESSSMAGLNWSKIPVVLFEMGFLTNPSDETKLSDVNYQNLIAEGIVEGILEYYR